MTSSERRSISTCANVRVGYWFLVVLFALSARALAQTESLQVRPADREQFSHAPREVVAITFMVRNASGSRDVEPRLILPAGWRPMTPDLPFSMAERDSALRLISFVIPERAAAGDYDVTYEVRDRQQPAASASYTVHVTVLPDMKLQVLSLDVPDFAVAGERYQSTFMLRNVGNSPLDTKFTVRSAQGADVEPRAGTLHLEPGESKNVSIESTAPKVRRRASEQLSLAVEIIGTKGQQIASGATQIVPRVIPDDAYRTLTTRVSADFVGRYSDDNRAAGWQPAISGSGTLDEDNTHYLSFNLRGPDARDNGSLGAADEYWLRYEHHNMSAALGDNTYRLSPLTELGRYGFGAQFGYQGHRWGATTFRMRDRFSAQGVEESGIGTYFRLSRDTVVDANFLEHVGGELPGQIASLRSQTRWSRALTSDIEVAQSEGRSEGEGAGLSERGRAYRANLSGSLRSLRYYATGWQADPEYRGYLRDKMYFSAGFDVPRIAGWSFRGHYRLQDWNLEEPEDLNPNPLAPNVQDLIRFAPTERQASLGTGHALGRWANATLDVTTRNRTDGHASTPIDVESRAVRVGFSRSWRRFSALYSIERGHTRDEISLTRFDSSLQMLSASWRASTNQTYGLYVLRDDNAFSNEREPVQTTFGASASYALNEATFLSLNAQRNDTERNRGGLYDLSVTHQRQDGMRFSLIGRRVEGRHAQTDVMLRVSMPFAMPVARKADVGSVRGRVYDSETGAGLKSVVLNLDGLTAVSNANGEFAFPVVKANTYRLSMDRANVDVGKVPVERLPLDIDVAPHERHQVQIALVRTASVSVQVRLRARGESTGASAATSSTTHGAENVLVVLTRGDTIYRRLTDSQGRVKLGGLAPGSWTVTLATDTIPQGYSGSAAEQRLEIAPGTAAAAEFELAPIVREIRMLAPLQVQAR